MYHSFVKLCGNYWEFYKINVYWNGTASSVVCILHKKLLLINTLLIQGSTGTLIGKCANLQHTVLDNL